MPEPGITLYELDRRISAVEDHLKSKINDVEHDVAELKKDLRINVAQVRDDARDQHRVIREDVARLSDKVAATEERMNALLQGQIDRHNELMEALRDLQRPPRPPIWESTEGRRMVILLCATVVVASVALAGGVSLAEIGTLIGTLFGLK